jgi:molybdopterin converting factor small subunit
MSITVNLYAAARHAAKQRSLSVEASTLVQLKAQCSLIVDGHSFGKDGDCQINSDQRIDVMPPFSGG